MEIGEKDRSARLELAARHEEGFKIRQSYIETARTAKTKRMTEMKKLKKERVKEEKELSKLKAMLDAPWMKDARDYAASKTTIMGTIPVVVEQSAGTENLEEEGDQGTGQDQDQDQEARGGKGEGETGPAGLNANERHALPAANANERHALPESDSRKERLQEGDYGENSVVWTAEEKREKNSGKEGELPKSEPDSEPEPEPEPDLEVVELRYEAKQASMKVDGDKADWRAIHWSRDVAFKSQDGEVVLFEPFSGGTWSGVEDQSSSFAFTWDPEYLYIAIEVMT